ncbi:MAG: hypothetical protein GY832_39405 [Chloroflexi bacterium]|nr:hypothetical protein [Chloroflexota bacterium]
MPSEGSRLGFGGGEQWGGDEDHHPQITNHRNKANPSTAIPPPLVVTDNSPPHRPRPKETSQCITWGRTGEDSEGADWGASAAVAEAMG